MTTFESAPRGKQIRNPPTTTPPPPCQTSKALLKLTPLLNTLTHRNDARNNKLTEQKKAVFVFLKTLRTF